MRSLTVAFIIGAFLFAPMAVWSQNNNLPADAAWKTESTAATPDLPAFNALGIQPSNLLRPSDVKTLTADVSSFIEGGRFVIPKGLAIEVSPGALIYRDQIITIDDYRSRKINLAYNTGISIGTNVNVNGLNQIAIGIRTTFINDADKFLNNDYRKKINSILKSKSLEMSPSWEAFKGQNKERFKSDNLDTLTIPKARTSIDSALEKEWETQVYKINEIRDQIKAEDKKFDEAHWNARRVEAAVAFVLTADDSLGKNLKPGTIQGWFTGSLPINKYGQFVGGLYGKAGFDSLQKDADKNVISRPEFSVTGSARIYAGVNKYKFFTELQVGVIQDMHRAVYQTNHLSIGAEAGVYNVLWINLFGGIKDVGVKQDNKSATTGFFKLDLKFNLPDWAKFRT